jgi:glycosyltransferase involved in cell wall biosynthesis
MDPLVSVIIPVYNRRKLLADAVRSVLMQSFGDLELIVVDDGSDDGTVHSLGPLSADPRIRLLAPPRSGMAGAVRNRGAAAARGRWLAFLDSDDIWLPEKLSQQFSLLRELGSLGRHPRIIHGREVWLRGDRIISQKGQRHRRDGEIFSDALAKCIIGPSTVMMERRLYLESGGFREDLEIAEDYEFWLRITALEPVAWLSEACIIKRAGSWPQLSEKYGQIEKFRIQGLLRLVKDSWFAGHRRDGENDGDAALLRQHQAEQTLAKKCRIYAAGCRKRGRLEEALRFEREIVL